ncbi:MAG: hypothetical protein GC185_11015 [Alphaproteobacteria bacterium]|nr:hypothetical protein [Alphaproteobacteria bacterium]
MKKIFFAFATLGFLALSTGAQAHEYNAQNVLTTTLSTDPLITLSLASPAVRPAPVVEYARPRTVYVQPQTVKYVRVPYGQWKKYHREDWRHSEWRHGHDRDYDHDRR